MLLSESKKQELFKRLDDSVYHLEKENESIRNDKEIMTYAINKNSVALSFASDLLKDDKDFILSILNGSRESLSHVSDRLKNDKEVVLSAVSKIGLDLEYASDRLKSDKEIVSIAIKNNGFAFQYANDDCRDNKELFALALDKVGDMFRVGSERLKKDKELAKIALKTYGVAIAWMCEDFKNDDELVELAISQNGNSIEYVNQRFKDDYATVKKAIENKGEIVYHMSPRLKLNDELVTLALKNQVHDLNHVPNLEERKHIVKFALSINPHTYKYLSPSMQNSKEFVDLFIKIQIKKPNLITFFQILETNNVNRESIAHFLDSKHYKSECEKLFFSEINRTENNLSDVTGLELLLSMVDLTVLRRGLIKVNKLIIEKETLTDFYSQRYKEGRLPLLKNSIQKEIDYKQLKEIKLSEKSKIIKNRKISF